MGVVHLFMVIIFSIFRFFLFFGDLPEILNFFVEFGERYWYFVMREPSGTSYHIYWTYPS